MAKPPAEGWFSASFAFIILCFIGFGGPAARADPMALWNIVHSQCVPHFRLDGTAKPCLRVDLSNGEREGVAFLKDLVGVAQVLAIPTARITGIEDPILLSQSTPNYFGAAWSARNFVFAALAHELPREAIGIAVNSQVRRSQDQLHFHVDCLDTEVISALSGYKDRVDTTWRVMTVALKGRRYWIRRLDSVDLSDVDPFRLLADGIEGAAAHMGQQTLVAIGSTFDGKSAFTLLADSAESDGGGHGEDLQDHTCKIAN